MTLNNHILTKIPAHGNISNIMNPTIPNIPSSNNNNINIGNNNIGSIEKKETNYGVSQIKVQAVKHITSTIISTREEFSNFLKQNNIKLLTSAQIFQQTKDFIQSSFVVYENQNNYKDSLVNFLEKNPQLNQNVQQLNDSLKSVNN